MNRIFKRITAVSLMIMMLAFSASPAMAATSKTYKSTSGGKNAVLVSGKTVTISNAAITKTGNSKSEKADFYGINAAVLAKNKGTLTLKNSTVTTSGTHANGVFAYGSGTTVKVSNTKITTKKNMSGGIMTTGGAKMIASNLTVKTSGNSSAAIRSDRGGGTVTVTKGTYSTSGVGSPAIYSTAKIAVTDAALKSAKSEAVVIEGGNSVSLTDCTVTGNNSTLNGQSKVKTNVIRRCVRRNRKLHHEKRKPHFQNRLHVLRDKYDCKDQPYQCETDKAIQRKPYDYRSGPLGKERFQRRQSNLYRIKSGS